MKNNVVTKEYYTYSSNVSSLGAGASLSNIVSIESDSTFIWQTATAFVTIDGTPLTEDSKVVPLIKISLTDSGSGRNLQNVPIAIDAISGRGQLPYILPIKRRFNANSNIQITYDNFSTGTSYANVQFNLHGYKIFYGG